MTDLELINRMLQQVIAESRQNSIINKELKH